MLRLTPSVEEISAAFQQFSQDPMERFRVKLRRKRAEQIRDLLSNPQAVDVDTFNREVWVLKTEVRLSGKELKDDLFADKPGAVTPAELEAALEAGELDYKGNSIWGSATQIFGAKWGANAGPKQQESIQKALAILNSPTISPLQKMQQINNIAGFGENSASGLVMVFHPGEFAIWNEPSRAALRRLGYPDTPLEQFQKNAEVLRAALGAKDYIELDWFLYQLQGCIYLPQYARKIVKIAPGHEAKYWPDCLRDGYICVGWEKTGDLREYESQEMFRKRFIELYQDAHKGSLATASRKANEVWSLHELKPGDLILANKGTGEVLAVGEVQTPGYHWMPERKEYNHTVGVKWDTAMATKITPQPTWANSTVLDANPEVCREIDSAVQNSRESDSAAHNHWVFQCRPTSYNLDGALQKLLKLTWRVTSSKDKVKIGDTVFLWECKPTRAIRAIATVTTDPDQVPLPDEELPFFIDKTLLAEPQPRVWLHIDQVLPLPVSYQQIKADPVLGSVKVFTGHQGTNYALSPEQAAALRALINTPKLPEDRFEAIYESLRSQSLYFPREILANYLLALQAKRFVILSGISGTGKTKLAKAVAEYFCPQKLPAPAPADSLELQVQPYMRKYHRLVLPADLRVMLRTASQVEMEYAGGIASLTLNKYQGVIQVLFSGEFRAWFDAKLQTGDHFYLAVVPQDDATNRLRIILPESQEPVVQAVRVVAVRPDWTDNHGLLGYYNPLTAQYEVTHFLQLLLDANRECDRAKAENRSAKPFFAILDEMNLARVEHYFSDFLSCLESGDLLTLHKNLLIEAGEMLDVDAIPRQLPIPPNLFFTGTVNIDETTYMFSPKVLDRAFTIELNQVDLERYTESVAGIAAAETSPLSLPGLPEVLTLDTRPKEKLWATFTKLQSGEMYRIVVDLHRLLARYHRHFGYRVADEIARFVLLAHEQAGDTPGAHIAALDLALLQKVLPKFHGTQQELELPLTQLFSFAVAGKNEVEQDPSQWLVADATLVRKAEAPAGNAGMAEQEVSQTAGSDASGVPPVLPRTAAKVWRMLARLREQGFTSYME